ncbi:MAG: hypothetical protein LBF71_05445 [Campylobacteraceae bacterium]|jgi:hypothetical protein|nr:hypothetical protein [Campylobacteraceae bacterium]
MFAKRLDALLTNTKMTSAKLAETLYNAYEYKISKESITKYRDGSRTPKPDFIEMVLKVTNTKDANVLFFDNYTPRQNKNIVSIPIKKFDVQINVDKTNSTENTDYGDIDINYLPQGTIKENLISTKIGDEWIIIELKKNNPLLQKDDFYLICLDGVNYIKYLNFEGKSIIHIKNDENQLSASTFDKRTDKREFEIVGKVVARIKLLGSIQSMFE